MTDLAYAPDQLDERYRRLRLVSPSAERAVRESLEKIGQLHAVIGCTREGGVALVDGFKRVHAARALGLCTLRVRVLELSETAAIAAVMSLNRTGRGLSDLEQALCVRALIRDHELTQVAVGELLGKHKSWVSRRLLLAEHLCESVAEDVRAGLVTTTVAREIARLPRGNQPAVSAAIAKAGLTSRQGAELIALFEKSADGVQRDYLLGNPREALAAHGTKEPFVAHDPRLIGWYLRPRSQRIPWGYDVPQAASATGSRPIARRPRRRSRAGWARRALAPRNAIAAPTAVRS